MLKYMTIATLVCASSALTDAERKAEAHQKNFERVKAMMEKQKALEEAQELERQAAIDKLKDDEERASETSKNKKLSEEAEAARVKLGAEEAVKDGVTIDEFVKIEIDAKEADEIEATIIQNAKDAFAKALAGKIQLEAEQAVDKGVSMDAFVAQQVKDMDQTQSQEDMATTAAKAYTNAKQRIDFANENLENLDDLVKQKQEAELKKWRDEQLEKEKDAVKAALEQWKEDELHKLKEPERPVIDSRLKLAAEQAVDKGISQADFLSQQLKGMDTEGVRYTGESVGDFSTRVATAYIHAKALLEFAKSHLDNLDDLVKKQQEEEMKKWRDAELEKNKQVIQDALEKWKKEELEKAHAQNTEHISHTISPELKLAAEQAVYNKVSMEDFITQAIKDKFNKGFKEAGESEEDFAKKAGAAYTNAKMLINFAQNHLDNLDDLVKQQQEIEMKKWRDEQLDKEKDAVKAALEKWRDDELHKLKEPERPVDDSRLKLAAEQAVDKKVIMADFITQQMKDVKSFKRDGETEEEFATRAGVAYTAAQKLIDFANSHLDDLSDLVKKQQEAEMKMWMDAQLEKQKDAVKASLEKWRDDALAQQRAINEKKEKEKNIPVVDGHESTWRDGGVQNGKFTDGEHQKVHEHDPKGPHEDSTRLKHYIENVGAEFASGFLYGARVGGFAVKDLFECLEKEPFADRIFYTADIEMKRAFETKDGAMGIKATLDMMKFIGTMVNSQAMVKVGADTEKQYICKVIQERGDHFKHFRYAIQEIMDPQYTMKFSDGPHEYGSYTFNGNDISSEVQWIAESYVQQDFNKMGFLLAHTLLENSHIKKEAEKKEKEERQKKLFLY